MLDAFCALDYGHNYWAPTRSTPVQSILDCLAEKREGVRTKIGALKSAVAGFGCALVCSGGMCDVVVLGCEVS